MSCPRMSVVCVLLMSACSVFLSRSAEAQDALAFPEIFENENLKPADNRMPLYKPDKCGENELLYPGDQLDDWICDCKAAHLYFPTTEKCYPAYEQGPCKWQQMLVLPPKGVVPICESNFCPAKRVPIVNNRCVTIGSRCDPRQFQRTWGVNATTLRFQCLNVEFKNRFPIVKDNISPTTEESMLGNRFADEDEPVTTPKPLTPCHPGCKRFQDGSCPGQS